MNAEMIDMCRKAGVRWAVCSDGDALAAAWKLGKFIIYRCYRQLKEEAGRIILVVGLVSVGGHSQATVI